MGRSIFGISGRVSFCVTVHPLPGTDPDTGPLKNLGTDHGINPGTDHGADLGIDPNADLNTYPGLDPSVDLGQSAMAVALVATLAAVFSGVAANFSVGA